jgi:hypothetical protein
MIRVLKCLAPVPAIALVAISSTISPVKAKEVRQVLSKGSCETSVLYATNLSFRANVIETDHHILQVLRQTRNVSQLPVPIPSPPPIPPTCVGEVGTCNGATKYALRTTSSGVHIASSLDSDGRIPNRFPFAAVASTKEGAMKAYEKAFALYAQGEKLPKELLNNDGKVLASIINLSSPPQQAVAYNGSNFNTNDWINRRNRTIATKF